MAGWDQLFRYAGTDATPYNALFAAPEETKGRGFLTTPMSDRVLWNDDLEANRDMYDPINSSTIDWRLAMRDLVEKQRKGGKLDAADRALLAVFERQQREQLQRAKEYADRVDRERAMPRPVPYLDYDLPPPPPDGRWYGGPR